MTIFKIILLDNIPFFFAVRMIIVFIKYDVKCFNKNIVSLHAAQNIEREVKGELFQQIYAEFITNTVGFDSQSGRPLQFDFT